MNQHLQTILNLIQQSQHLSVEEKAALSKAAKDADKSFIITEFKLDRTEKVKKTTAILLEETIAELEQKRKAVEAQNRELEIEAALERMRTVAMAMGKPEDLLNISKIQFDELKQLGFTEMRNALIGIFHDDKNYFADYDYSDFSGGSITKIPYNKNRVIDRSLKQMKSATDAFTEFIVEGNELEEWKAFRKQNGEYDDTRITSVLYYYFYSIEQGNVGISTFKKISDEQLNILKKFRNIFDLAYKRYVDITKAEAQAREAKIQLALERARTQSMIMQHSIELDDTLRVFHEQVLHLNIPSAFSFLWLPDEDKDRHVFWAAWAENLSAGQAGNSFKSKAIDYPLDRNEPATALCLVDWKSNEPVVSYHVPPDGVENYFAAWSELIAGVEELKPENFSDGLYYVEAFMKYGCFGVMVKNALPEDEKKILERFAIEFERAYTRFLDLQKAEAQARESQIELALERVRARTMAMQKSDELKEVIQLVYQQFVHLNIHIEHTGFLMDYKTRDDLHIWLADQHLAPSEITIPCFDSIPNNSIKEAKEKGKNFFKYRLDFEEKNKFYQDLFKFIPDVPVETLTYYLNCPALAGSGVLLENIGLYIENFDGIPYTDEENNTLMRLGKVFQQTYTRFLDLQKAEEQARESQIQLALERVRARTMAMQHSNELKDAAALLFQQVKSLGAPAYSCGYNIWGKDDKEFTSWMSTQDGSIINGVPNIPLTEDANFIRYVESKQNAEAFFVLELRGERMQEHYQYLKTIPAFKGYFDYTVSVGFDLPETQIHHVANFSEGNLLFITLEPCPEFHDVFKRFAAVFQQTYTRFLDLQNAEAQARESQIQLALERVRARTMAMQKSDELSETVYVLFQQFKELGENPDQATIGIVNEDEKVIGYWVTMYGKPINKVFKFSIDEPNVTNKIYEAWKANKKSLMIDLSGDALTEFMTYRAGKGGAAINPDEKRRIINVAFFSKGLLNVQSKEERSEESIKLLERFVKVFEQTYTRFLDLQKGEAQVREAQIEAALERVRSRTIAMQRSEDLFAVIREVNAQLQLLNFRFDSADFLTDYSDNGYKIWVASVQESFAKPFYITASDNKISELLKETVERGDDFFTFNLNREEKNKYFEHVFQSPVAKEASDESKQFIYDAEGMAISCFVVKNIILSISNFACIPYNDAENEIIRRFAFVFEQTYTRFLDLQNAEAQAREAQIETALEKVRSRSLAMHKSEELQEVVHTVFEKLKELNVDLYTAIIFIFEEGSKDVVWWLANKANQQYAKILIPYANIHYLKNLFDAKESGKDFFAATYSFEEKNELFHHLFEHTDFKYVPDEQKKFLLESELATMSIALAKNTGINITSYSRKSFSECDNEILKRFAKIFDQAYTRFLDLQKAEAQAREAQIEAALERVRSRTMGMQKSEELKEVIQVVYDQFVHLDINVEHTGFIIDYKATDDRNIWVASKYGLPSYFTIPYFDSVYYNSFNKAKEKGLDFFATSLSFEEKNIFYKELFKYIPGIPEDDMKFYFSCPGLAISTVLLDNVGLYIENFSGIPYSDEDNKTLMRFGKVFQQTYTRFLDLQKAEAQAKEAQIEAALERVRSRTLAMQKSEELAETAAVLFNQLVLLGIEPNRLYIGIIKDDNGHIEFWATDEEGSKVSTQFIGDAARNTSMKKMYDAWKAEKKSLTIDMQGKELSDYFHYMADDLQVPFTKGLSQKRRLQTIAIFSKGFLGMASSDEQPAETSLLLERFAAVFNLTYTRFNDLKLAEAHALQAEQDLIEIKSARQKAEDALTELQATQKQLIQSEKMASLGELTAGIAHEIQNPLNFVNNFSEVNQELISELIEEVDKGNTEEVKAIANDIKENEEKINHHGKRADGIVKGMLQHSRSSSATKEPTDINKLADEYLRLSYHGLRAKDKSFNADFKTDFDKNIERINMVPQDIGRVLLNLINNAFYATNEKLAARGSKLEADYKPLVSVQTKKLNDKIEITVKDNGNGIPQSILDKIFQPFFTTKPTGQGTGLGLSLSYDIIKAHGGEIKVESKEGEGTAFIIQLSVV